MPVFTKPDWAKDTAYELMEPILQDNSQAKLSASFTPSNGIRLHIEEMFEDEKGNLHEEEWVWTEFDLEASDAIALGEALIRWATRGHSWKEPA